MMIEFMGLTDANPVLAPDVKEELSKREGLPGEEAVSKHKKRMTKREREREIQVPCFGSESELLRTGLGLYPMRNSAKP